jgi:hypothetical protein
VASGELVCAAAQSARGKTIRLGWLSDEEDLNGPLAPRQADQAADGTARPVLERLQGEGEGTRHPGEESSEHLR